MSIKIQNREKNSLFQVFDFAKKIRYDLRYYDGKRRHGC